MDLPVLAKANISPVSAGYDVSKVFSGFVVARKLVIS